MVGRSGSREREVEGGRERERQEKGRQREIVCPPAVTTEQRPSLPVPVLLKLSVHSSSRLKHVFLLSFSTACLVSMPHSFQKAMQAMQHGRWG